MNWTRQRKTFVAILALAGVALTVDRLFLSGGPAEAHAAPAETPPESLSRTTPTTATLSAPPPSTPMIAAPDAGALTVAQRLSKLQSGFSDAGEQPVDNAFAAPQSWLEKMSPGKPKPSHTSHAADQAPEFRLTMIVRDKRRQPIAATLNGRTVELGKDIDGYTLTELRDNPQQAVLSGPSGEIKVSLFSQADSDARNKR